MKTLYKTTIIIWTEDNPSGMELEDLAREATSGMGYCSYLNTKEIDAPTKDKDWDGTEFFYDDEWDGSDE
jgi:hypothetical protein